VASWQRHARLALGLFAVAFAVLLWFIIGERKPPPASVQVERIDPKAIAEIKGGDVVQVKGSERDVRVEFGSQVSYEDGRQKFTQFKATIDNRSGRTLVISGEEAWVGSGLSSYDLRGNVTLATSDGFTATTPRATFTEAEGILRGEGPVKFQRARVSGSGVGFSYDRELDRLWLNDQAIINVAPQDGGGAMQVSSGAAGHSRIERYLRFERGATMRREGQVITANEVMVFLLKDRDEPDTVELRGNASVDGSTGTGALQRMQARDINLNYADDGRTLQNALLSSQAGIQLAQPGSTVGQQLNGEWIEVALAPDGSVNNVVSRDNVRVSLPATAAAPTRVITSTSMTGTGEPGKGLTAMTFEGGVEFREAGAAGQPERVAKATTLKATLSSAGTVEQATFTTAFRFENGAFTAQSGDAQYNVTRGTLALTSPQGITRPHLADQRVTLDAKTIDVTLDPRRITAAGAVAMQLGAGRRREGERGTTLLSDKEVVFINAEELSLDEQTGSGKYSGQARLWQQESGTTIKADTITMNEKQGTLVAVGKVLTTLPIAGRTEGGKTGTSIAQAAEFEFDDVKRRALFLKQAQFDGAQGNLRAQRIELGLAPRDNELQSLEARDAVTISIDKREATGAQLVFDPAEDKYVLIGTPARFIEGCQETTGRNLTFYRGSDRVRVDGEEVRTQTKGGSAKCPSTPH
jgi:lipopolysaccharide export system protein LptA